MQCLRLISFLDSEKMMRYLDLYHIQFLYQKAGFLLKHFQDELKLPDSFFNFCYNNIVKSKRYLTDKDEKNLVYNTKWRLFVPKNLMAFMEQGGDEPV